MSELKSNVALVTGAGSGIGRAVAKAFLQTGYSVVLAGRRESALTETVELARTSATTFHLVPTDVQDPFSVAHLFDSCRERFGRLDVLFNNAGTTARAASVEDIPFEQWRLVIDTNVTGAFLCIQNAFRIMKAQNPMGGRIINNGSISATTPRPKSLPYTASKHAIAGLTKAASLDGRKYNIACGQIDIGNASTSMVAGFTEGVEQADGSILCEPAFDVEHVAKSVLHMASLPLDANIQFMTILATKMPFIGRG